MKTHKALAPVLRIRARALAAALFAFALAFSLVASLSLAPDARAAYTVSGSTLHITGSNDITTSFVTLSNLAFGPSGTVEIGPGPLVITFNNDRFAPTGATAAAFLVDDNSTLTFSNNTTTANGGAMLFAASSTLILATAGSGSYVFDGNKANNGGALVFANTSSGTFANVVFTNNSATAGGGAIHFAGSNINLSFNGATFKNNTATQGGVFNSTQGGSANPLSISVNNVLFASNTASGGNGGGVLSNTGGSLTFSVTNALFQNNSASGSANAGGVIFNNGGNVIIAIASATFQGNSGMGLAATATTGGGVYFSSGNTGATTLTSVLFTSNSTSSSGGVIMFFNTNPGTLLVSSATFDSNSAGYNGGAISLYGNTNVTGTFANALFINNHAGNYGGAYSGISNNGAYTIPLAFINTSFIGNTAGVLGGAFYMGGGTTFYNVTTSATIAGNTDGSGANSFYFASTNANAATAPGLALNISSAAHLDMLDPMASSITTNSLVITQTGLGLWNLGGNNALNATGAGLVTFTVSSGTLRLYRDAEVANPTAANPAAKVAAGSLNITGASSSFTLKAAATLLAAGGNTIAAPTITFDPASIITLDLAGGLKNNAAASILTLNTTNLISDWTQTINLLNPSALPTLAQGDYINLISLVGSTFANDPTANVLGLPTGDPLLHLRIDGGTTLQIYYGTFLNKVLTWTGAALDGSWKGANWDAGSFSTGDIINLAGAPTSAAITIDTAATPAGMFVSGNADYTITGPNAITTDATAGTFTGSDAANGKLVLGAKANPDGSIDNTAAYAGTLTLANTAGGATNTFTNGIDINSGQLVGNAATLGVGIWSSTIIDATSTTTITTSATVTIGATGTLTINQDTANATYSAPIIGTGVLNKTGTAQLTLAIDNSAFNGTTNVTAGILRLTTGAARLGGDINITGGLLSGTDGVLLGGAGKTLTIADSGTLRIGIGAAAGQTLTIGGNLALNDGATLDYTNLSNTLAITNAATLLGSSAVTINVTATTAGSWSIFNIGNLAGTTFDTTGITVTYNGALIDPTTYHFDSAYNLVFAWGSNVVLTWTGLATPNTWDTTSLNWTYPDGPRAFTQGDIVNLVGASLATPSSTITLAAPVTVAAMYVNGAQSYKITGDSITATTDTTASALAATLAGGGKLVLGKNADTADATTIAAYTGTLDLTGITGANHFTGGVEIDSGVLRIANTNQLGTTLSGLTFAASTTGAPATLQIAQNIIFDSSAAGLTGTENRLALANNTAGNIVLEDGATLALTGNANTLAGAALNIGNNSSLTITTGSNAQVRFTNNSITTTSNNGAAINLGNNAILTLANALFDTNAATGLTGNAAGAINFNQGSSAIITSATFQNNTAAGRGGDIFTTGPGVAITITDALFQSNTSGLNNTTGGGGAIFNASATSNFTLTDVRFLDNTAKTQGGGALASTSADALFNITNALFQSNTAAAGNGGAIFINITTNTLTLRDVTFTGNNAAAGNGGAIYLGSAGDTININVSSGSATLFAANTTGTGANLAPNSIYFNAAATLSVNAAANGSLDMLDPMTAANIPLTITQTGLGTWNLGGSSTLGTTTAAAVNFTVTQGTLHLYRGGANAEKDTTATHTASTGNLTINGATSTFTLKSGATLSAGGGNTLTAPAITLEDNSTLAFDLTGATANSTTYSVLTLNATTLLDPSAWTQNITLLGLTTLTPNEDDTYNLLTLTGASAATASLFTDVDTFARVTGLLDNFHLQLSADDTILQLLYSHIATTNSVLTWTGAFGNSWTGTTNWMTSTAPNATYLKGDIINLADDSVDPLIPAPATTTLNVNTTTSATISGMYVSGTTSYTITGAAIVTATDIGTLSGSAAATGKLILGARALDDASDILTSDPLQPSAFSPSAFFSGTLTLANASNNFTGGIEINTGELVGNAQTLGAGAIGITNDSVLTFSQTASGTYAAPINGAGTLNKTGTATLTLTANNTFAGTTNINAGALLLGTPGSAGILPATTAALGGNITVNATALLGGTGTATGNVTVNAGGALAAGTLNSELGTPNSFSIADSLTLNPGATLLYNLYGSGTSDKLTVGSLGALAANSATIALNAPINGTYNILSSLSALDTSATTGFATTINGAALSGRTHATYAIDTTGLDLLLSLINSNTTLTWTGATNYNWDNTNPANWTGADTRFIAGDSVTFNDTAATPAAQTVTVADNVTAADMTVTNATGTYTFTGTGSITTSATATNLADATGKLTKDGLGLLVLANTATNNFEQGIALNAGALTGNAATLNTPAITTAASTTLTYNQIADATTAANITGAGALVKTGSANLTLTGTTNYGGTTSVSSGTLTLGNANQIAASSAVTLAAGSVLDATAAAQTLNQLSGTGNIAAGSSALTLTNSTASTTYAGVINGASATVTKLGANTLTLAANNTFAGALTISEGTIQLGSGAAAGSVAGNIVNNAALVLNHGAANVTLANAISGNGTITKADTGTLTLTGNSSAFTGVTTIATGGLILANNATLGGDLTLADNTTFAGTGTLGNVTTGANTTITIGAAKNTTGPETLALTGTLNLGATTNLVYDIYSASTSDLITAAALVRTGTNTLDINLGSFTNGAYTLITTTELLAATATDNLGITSNGNALSDRTTATFAIDGGNLILTLLSQNASGLRWDGTNTGLWQHNQTNWQPAAAFLNGDSVIFDDTAAGTHAVTVDTAGVQVGDMLVTTASAYTFTGGAITASSTLTIDGSGLVILNNSTNAFAAGIAILSGTLQGNAATLAAPAIANNADLVFNQTTNAAYSSLITGTGALTKIGAGALILDNPANHYTGGLNILAGTLTLADGNTTTQGPIAIAANATLLINNAASYTIQNALTGAGLLNIALTAPTGAVNFTTAAGNAFAGTVTLGASTFTLDTTNAAALTNATLQLNAGNTTIVASALQPFSLSALSLTGGKLDFTTITPSATTAPITVNTLAIGASGTIQATLPTGGATTTNASLLAQAAGVTLQRLVTATTVTGNASTLALVDQTGAPITAVQTSPIAQNGATVATGTYAYKLTNDATSLNVSYALTALTIATGQTVQLTPDAGDTGIFNVRISGTGNLTIDATNAPVTLGVSNNFTGATTLTSGTLNAAASNALGGPANTLTLTGNSAYNLAGNTQTLATLTTGSNTAMNIAGGVLNLTNATINGALAGAGLLNLANGGNLTVNSANPDFASPISIAANATLTLGNAAALGAGNLNLAAATSTLNLNNAVSGTLANPLSGAGTLNFNGTGTTTLAAPSTFAGAVNVNGPVIAANTSALGAAAVNVSAANALTYTATGTIANNIAGAGTLNLAATDSTPTTLTGANTIANINVLTGATILANAKSLGTPATNLAIANAATVILTQPNTTLGNVTMTGASTLGYAKTLPAGNTLTLTSLKSDSAAGGAGGEGGGATLSLNTNIGATTPLVDQLKITNPSANAGKFTLSLNNTGAEPTPAALAAGITLPFIDATSAGAATFAGSGVIKSTDDTLWLRDYSWRIDTAAAAGSAPTIAITQGKFSAAGSNIIVNATGAMPLTWYTELDTLTKRLGDLHISPREKPGADVWLRGYAQRINVNDKDTLVPFRETQYGTEVGLDYGGRPSGYGASIYAGAAIGYGASNRDITGVDASASVTSAQASLYATFITPDGWYLDLVGKYNHFKNEFSATDSTGSVNGNYNNDALGLSVEAGKRIPLGGGSGHWFVTPSAQATMARINGQNYTATTGATTRDVTLAQTTSRQLRAGAQLACLLPTPQCRLLQPYAKAYLAQQWTNGGEISISNDTNTPYAPTIKGARLELGLGVNWQLQKALQLYIDYECAFARDYTKPYGLTLGVSYAW